jgi:hypothetical protein
MFRDKMISFAYGPQKPIPQSKAAHSQSALRPFDAGMCGGICSFAAAVADAGVCARAWAAVRGLTINAGGGTCGAAAGACAPLGSGHPDLYMGTWTTRRIGWDSISPAEILVGAFDLAGFRVDIPSAHQ